MFYCIPFPLLTRVTIVCSVSFRNKNNLIKITCNTRGFYISKRNTF